MAVTWKKLAYTDDFVPYTGAISNVDTGVFSISSAGHMQKETVGAGDTLTVPSGYCMVVTNFVIDGTLVLDGDMVIL